MSTQPLDLFVIGAGSGGVRAARIAAQHGARVAIAEEYRFGGTCVIRGCVPKKFLVYASRFADSFDLAADYGWTLPQRQFDWATLIANKNRQITNLESIYTANLDKAGVTLIHQRATVSGAQEVTLADGTRIPTKRILIATGGTPHRDPAWADMPGVITSEELFELPALPKRLAVIGGGYIAVEFACLMHKLGSEVTLFYRGEQLLRGFDQDLRDGLYAALCAQGIDVRLNTDIVEMTQPDHQVSLRDQHGGQSVADVVLMAIGRMPNTRGLGLEAQGVTLGDNGRVEVDACAVTKVPSIFAIGDVTDRNNLTPVAIREGHALADREFGGRQDVPDLTEVATAVFTTPELGTVGLSEAEAVAKYPQIEVYESRFRTLDQTLGAHTERVLLKLIVDGQSQRVLGAHMLGPDAGEQVQLLAIAIKLGATKDDLDRTVAVHPTLAEEWVTMGSAPRRIVR